MNILVKFPTRSRPEKFIQTFNKLIELSEDKSITYIINLDKDDKTIDTYKELINSLQGYNITVCIGTSKGKVDAINRDMVIANNYPWDILVLASDDMIPQVAGWDTRIKNDMQENYPDLDGILYYFDGYQKLNTMPIMGRAYYKRFNYIYHPDYVSLWCDNEFQEVAEMLGKQTFYNEVLFKHETWFNSPKFAHTNDELMKINQSLYQTDKTTFWKRKALNFDLK